MKSATIRALAIAGLAIALPMLAAPNAAQAANPYACFTDDGYGRKLPCSFRYKAHHAKWRNAQKHLHVQK